MNARARAVYATKDAGWRAVRAAQDKQRRKERPAVKRRVKTHCKRGHPLIGDNIYTYHGSRSCRACERDRYRENRDKVRARERGYYEKRVLAATGRAAKRLVWADNATRFWRYVEKSDGCWLWRGGCKPAGYGVFSERLGPRKTRTWNAHRYAWTLVNGPIPDGKMLCHQCDVKNCVKPNHLELGDASRNIREAIERGLFTKANRFRTHCLRGHHLLTPETLGTGPKGDFCRVCRRESSRRHKALKRQERLRQQLELDQQPSAESDSGSPDASSDA